MRNDCSAKKVFIGKSSPKVIDTVRFNNRYIDVVTIKEKATGIISALIFTGLAAFTFVYLLFF
ncbi:hypothetical protein [Butyrivibrio sp. JL13D10]|uniref:hypothetical protein n=1 Tax=Butyrivibrio sp. JL13D10 TaxID=3236815 RepID=UPI0038B520FA